MATLLFAPQPLAYTRGSVRRRFRAANVRERQPDARCGTCSPARTTKRRCRAEVSQKANERYLDALASVDGQHELARTDGSHTEARPPPPLERQACAGTAP